MTALASRGAWTRDTAQRLLVERQEKSVVPALQKLATEGESPVSRVHALWTLVGLSALTPELVPHALDDRSADVREQGVILLRRAGFRPAEVAKYLPSLARDPAPRVRVQAALAAGDLDTPEAISLLAALARLGAADEWQRLAVLSGLGRTAWPFLQTLLREQVEILQAPTPGEQALLRETAALIGVRQQEAEIAGLVALIAGIDPRGETVRRSS